MSKSQFSSTSLWMYSIATLEATIALQVRHHQNDTRNASVVVGTHRLWKFQIITQDILIHFHPTLRPTTHHQPMVGSGLLIHYTHPIHILQYQPIDYQSTISVGAQYTLEATIVLQVRHHRNDIVLTQRILDIHMNMYHAMYQYFMYHTVMCRRVNCYYHISWMYYYDTVVANIMISN